MASENVSANRRTFLRGIPLVMGTAAVGTLITPKLLAQDPACGTDGPSPDPACGSGGGGGGGIIQPNCIDDANTTNLINAISQTLQYAADNNLPDLWDYPSTISWVTNLRQAYADLGNIQKLDTWVFVYADRLIQNDPNEQLQIQLWNQNGLWWVISIIVNGLSNKQLGIWGCATDAKFISVLTAVGATLVAFPQTKAFAGAVFAAAAWFKVLSQANGCP